MSGQHGVFWADQGYKRTDNQTENPEFKVLHSCVQGRFVQGFKVHKQLLTPDKENIYSKTTKAKQ